MKNQLDERILGTTWYFFTFAVCKILFYFIFWITQGFEKITVGVIITSTIVSSLLPALLVVYMIRTGEFRRILIRRRKKLEQERARIKDRLSGLKKQIQEETYPIVDITCDPEKVGVFTIYFDGTINPNAKPKITVDGVSIGIQSRTDSSVTCYAGQCITAAKREIVIASGNHTVRIGNPWYLNLKQAKIKWQCKGHKNERRIYIHDPGTLHANRNIAFTFNIMINRHSYGPFIGRVFRSKGNNAIVCLVVDISSLKANCTQNTCILQTSYDASCKTALPKPTVIVVNGNVVQ